MAIPGIIKPTTFHQFSALPPEIRQKIWYEAYDTSQRANVLGPGLWTYEPGCWQVRQESDLDKGDYALIWDGFSQDEWDQPYGALLYATWNLGTNHQPPSGIGRANHEARTVVKAYVKEKNDGKENDKDNDDGDEDEESCEDSDMDEAEFDEIKPNDGYFYQRKDCLYVPTSRWDECATETRKALARFNIGPDCGLDTLWRIAVTPDALTKHLESLALFIEAASIVKELQIIFGDPPNELAEDEGWLQYQYAGGSKFVWECSGTDDKWRFAYHDGGTKHAIDDEFRNLIDDIQDEIISKFYGGALHYHDKFRIRPVLAVRSCWL